MYTQTTSAAFSNAFGAFEQFPSRAVLSGLMVQHGITAPEAIWALLRHVCWVFPAIVDSFSGCNRQTVLHSKGMQDGGGIGVQNIVLCMH